MPENTPNPFGEEFWSQLEPQMCDRIKAIDRTVDALFEERERIRNFLKDHGRRCA